MKAAKSKQALTQGVEHHRAGRLAAAAACYETALRETPQLGDALHLLGLVRAAEGDVARGIELIRQAVKRQPRFAAAYFNLGNLLQKQNELSKAIDAYQRAVALEPKLAEAQCNLGCALETAGRRDEALAAFRSAIAANRGFVEAHRNLGLLHHRQGRLDLAAASLGQAVALQPEHAPSHHDFGLVLQDQGRIAEALVHLEHAARLDPGDARTALNFGAALQAAGRLGEAETACRRALQLQPDCLSAWCQLGHALKGQDRLDEAVAAFRQALALDSHFVAAHHQLGSTLLGLGAIDEAVASWHRAAALTPWPRRSRAPAQVTATSTGKHRTTLETSRFSFSLEYSVVLLAGADAVTICAPAFFQIVTGPDQAAALAQLDNAIRRLAAGSAAEVPPTVPANPDRQHVAATLAEPGALWFLFAQVLNKAQHHREALEILREAGRRGFESKHFLFFHGLLAAWDGQLDEAAGLHQRAVAASLAAGENPVLHGSSAVPDYLVGSQSGADTRARLREASLHFFPDAPPPAEGPAVPAPLVEIETLNLLAEDLINYHADDVTARQVYLRRDELQQNWLRACGLGPSETLYLGSDWVRNIGHNAFLGILVELQQLGLAPWRRIVLLVREQRIANRPYLEAWRRHVTIVTDSGLVDRFEPLTTVAGFRLASVFPFAGRAPLFTTEISNAVEEKWEEAGRGPLLALDPEAVAAGRQALERLGLGDRDWFVALHVRESGYHGSDDQAQRNAQIASYVQAVKSITQRGGWVIRLGDPTMSRLPELPRVVDYAHSALKSPALDVFLCAECRFFIGVTSGLSHVPYSFGRPVVLTNWANTGPLPAFPRQGLFLPKLIFSTAEQRLLPFRDSLQPVWRRRSCSTKQLADHEACLVDNTPEEITAIVKEMLGRLDGTRAVTAEESALRQRFAALLPSESARGLAAIGADFLRRHEALLR